MLTTIGCLASKRTGTGFVLVFLARRLLRLKLG